jgi:LysM repeat protein
MRYWTRIAVLLTMVGGSGLLVACGTDDSASSGTLAPILTTTTTTTIPETTTTLPEFYIIQKGDSLSSIAKQFGVDQAVLQAINEITNPDKIFSGLKIRIPQPGTVLPPTDTTVPFTFDGTTVPAP